MEYEVKGTIKTILPIESGTSKAGKEWKKVNFIVENQGGYEGREQVFAFQIFGGEKVDKFIQHNAEGMAVNVKFNIRCNEFNGKYFTNLEAWRVESGEAVEQSTQTPHPEEEGSDSLPF
tara:strand:+ start:148 stop:504 length:357 start_codon:yes stop_codon:yes gene_type:complete